MVADANSFPGYAQQPPPMGAPGGMDPNAGAMGGGAPPAAQQFGGDPGIGQPPPGFGAPTPGFGVDQAVQQQGGGQTMGADQPYGGVQPGAMVPGGPPGGMAPMAPQDGYQYDDMQVLPATVGGSNPVVTVLLIVLTCGIYGIYLLVKNKKGQ
jgi:hypothetical protein